MGGIVFRPAVIEDEKELLRLCEAAQPGDYCQGAWPIWLKTPGALNLVAETDGRIVACRHHEELVSGEAWAQGGRVHPDWRRKSIGYGLWQYGLPLLKNRGVRVLRASISPSNSASLFLAKKVGFEVVAEVLRRRAQGRAKARIRPPQSSRPDEILPLIPERSIMASRRHLALFRRAYFSLNRGHLDQLSEHEALIRSKDGTAFAFLEPSRPHGDERIWITALGGEASGVFSLLSDFLWSMKTCGNLIVDSPADALLQESLDRLEFAPPGRDDRYVILELRLS